MILARKAAGIVGAAIVSLSVGATVVESEPTFVFLRPETSSLFRLPLNNARGAIASDAALMLRPGEILKELGSCNGSPGPTYDIISML